MVNCLKVLVLGVTLTAGTLRAAAAAANPPAPPTLPSDIAGKDGVKTYLLGVLGSINTAAGDLKSSANEYQLLINEYGGSPEKAAEHSPEKIAEAIKKMRDAYQRIDSFGYEYVEGIVAGVPSLQHYDVELDSGLPKAEATAPADVVADVVIKAGAVTLDHEGSLNNYLIEPTVFGTNKHFTTGEATLPGFDKPVALPNPQIVTALADYAIDGYARLTKDARAWQPTDKDCFNVIYNMTPTLADYFDEWKESKKTGGATGGRFVAVQRVSDMRGIMSSVMLTWQAVQPTVRAKDNALADSVSRGYSQILSFIDTISMREEKKALNIETIDALGSQAKERADKLTVQTAQAAALAGVEVSAQ